MSSLNLGGSFVIYSDYLKNTGLTFGSFWFFKDQISNINKLSMYFLFNLNLIHPHLLDNFEIAIWVFAASCLDYWNSVYRFSIFHSPPSSPRPKLHFSSPILLQKNYPDNSEFFIIFTGSVLNFALALKSFFSLSLLLHPQALYCPSPTYLIDFIMFF